MSRLGANWNYKYVLLTPVIGLAIFLVYIWFVGNYIPSLGKYASAYDVFLPFRSTHAGMNDLPTAPFTSYATLLLVGLAVACMAAGAYFLVKLRLQWWKVLLGILPFDGFRWYHFSLSYSARILSPGNSGEVNQQWTLYEYRHGLSLDNQHFRSLGIVQRLQYIFIDLFGTDKPYTIPGTTHPPGGFIIGFLIAGISKLLRIGGDVGLSWGIIVGLVNCIIVPVLISVSRRVYGRRIAVWTIPAVIFVSSVTMHFFSIIDGLASLFILTALIFLLKGITEQLQFTGKRSIRYFFLSGFMMTLAAQMTYGHALPIAAMVIAFVFVFIRFRLGMKEMAIGLIFIAAPAILYFVFEALISGGKSFWIARAIKISTNVGDFLQTVRPYPISQIGNFVLLGIFGGLYFFPALVSFPEQFIISVQNRVVGGRHVQRSAYTLAIGLSFLALAASRAVHLEAERTWHWIMVLVWPATGLLSVSLERIFRILGFNNSKIRAFCLMAAPQILISLALGVLVIDYY